MPESESISSYLMKLVDIAERQLESVRRLEEISRDHMAHTDARFNQVADMFIQVGAWMREHGTEMARTNQRIERLEQHIGELLRALLRGRGNGEGGTPP
jgi:hypothetical protein